MATLSLASFFNKLRIVSYSFELSENLVSSRDGGGQVLVSSVGPRIWQGSIACAVTGLDGYRQANVLLQTIQRPENTFLVFDKKGQFPARYKATDNLSNVKISAPVAGYSATLTGLPASYKLTAGDYFSVPKGDVSLLYQIVADVTANGSGVATVSLLHPLATGIAANAVVTLKQPVVTARYVPGTMTTGTVGLDRADGFAFSWTQTFKS